MDMGGRDGVMDPGLADDDDPRIRQVYRRLRTLSVIAALTMGVGFLSVMSVIAYRLVKAPSPGAPGAGPVERALALPEGARVVSVAADGGRIVATVEAGGRTSVHVLDAGTLNETGRLTFAPGGPAAPPTR